MHAATSVSPVAAFKPSGAPREQFDSTPRAKPTSVFYAPSDSVPEPTEGDTPLEEAWFKDRPDIIEGIKRGLADMAAGRVEFFDPFEGYEGKLDD